jgi:hypothetical protein
LALWDRSPGGNLRRVAIAALATFALAAPAKGQVAAHESANPLFGCYSFKGADEKNEATIEERFRLTAEPSSPEGLFGPWQVVTAVPGERLRGAKAFWSVGPDTSIRVLWEYDSARALLQFPQIDEGPSLPVEGLLAGPGPEPGTAQTIRGFVVRVSC